PAPPPPLRIPPRRSPVGRSTRPPRGRLAPATPHRPKARGGVRRPVAPWTAPSISDQERIDAAAAQAGLANQQIKTQRSDVVGDGIERDVLLVVQDLHIGAALVTAFGLDRSRPAFDFLIGDVLGRSAHA